MGIRFVLDAELTAPLRAEVVALWTDVSNAGGAVGFVPPVTADEVRPVAERAFAAVAGGDDRMLLGYDGAGRVVAALFFVANAFTAKRHWCTVKRVMVHPERQGRGFGVALMREAERVARAVGWEALHVTVRGGTGTERFYAGLGYREVGRLPGALRFRAGDDPGSDRDHGTDPDHGPDEDRGDDRDEILMWRALG